MLAVVGYFCLLRAGICWNVLLFVRSLFVFCCYLLLYVAFLPLFVCCRVAACS